MTGPLGSLKAAVSGRYTIVREIGCGGMATVYLAEDLKHHRQVALKVLRPELAAALGPERFLREIELSARLTHPHILLLHDSGNAGGYLYYVMPYVEGESLRDRLHREKQLPVDDALQISREVADALSYAHSRGVIHRDVKPENILLEAGHAVVADFGIARAIDQAGGKTLTETGIALGTPAYMSPEQAAGSKDLDGRSDLYSLGCVLYEMLAGHPPFVGATTESLVRQHLSAEPPHITGIRPAVPAHVAATLERALAKNPADRFNPVALFAEALSPRVLVQPPARGRRAVRWALLVAGAVIVTVAALVWQILRASTGVPSLGRSDRLTAEPGLEIDPAVSPDGKLVAYSAGNSARMRIFIRPVAGGRAIPLSDDSSVFETQPRWSPNGTNLLFLTQGGVAVAPALGGPSRAVVPRSATAVVRSASWSPDGTEIAFVRADSLLIMPMDGRGVRLVGTTPGLYSCAWNPKDRWIACAMGNPQVVQPGPNFGNIAPSAIGLFPTAGGQRIDLVEPHTYNQSPIWSADGRQLFFLSARDGPSDLYAMPITPAGRPRGAARRITAGLGAISASLSADGRRLAYAVYSAEANIWSIPIPEGPATTDQAAVSITTGNQVIEAMRVSPDGRWLLYDSNLRGNADIYRIRLDGGQPEQLTSEPWDEFAPDLSPDGSAIAYHSFRTGTRDIEVKPLGGGPIEYVAATPAQESYPVWSRDGRAILFLDQQVPLTLFLTRRQSAGAWSVPAVVTAAASPGDWSPDGRSVAYVSLPTPPADAGTVMVVSMGGGSPRRLFVPSTTAPRVLRVLWDPGGRRIYYKARDAEGRASLWSVDARGGTPRPLVRFPDPRRQSNRADFATDGKRLFFVREERKSDIFVAELLYP